MPTKSICVLANSAKKSGRCIAGKEVVRGETGWKLTETWIRPISHLEHGQIEWHEANRHSLLDIVDIPLLKPAQVEAQPEDWLIHQGLPWTSRGRFRTDVLDRLLDQPPNLWLTPTGRSDRVDPQYLHEHQLPSLYLIKVNNFQIVIDERTGSSGNPEKKRRANFIYNGAPYDLALTDPQAQNHYYPNFPNIPTGPIVNGPSQSCVLCVSLGLEFHGYHYKLVAAVIE